MSTAAVQSLPAQSERMRLRYYCRLCCLSSLLPFAGEAPFMFSMTIAGGQRSAVAWKNHPSLHLWTCPRLKGKQ